MKKQGNKGITLIALVITIIVLLILAGVSIAMLTGENGILSQAQRAKSETENAQANEESILDNYAQYIEGSTNGGTLTTVTGNETENTKVQDSLGNTVWVPAGFKVVNPGDNVEDGIVIEDVNHGATAGSQFVWIPVGTIQTSKGEIAINLDRYTFEENGSEIAQADKAISNIDGSASYSELNSSSSGNVVATKLNEFLSKVDISGGYYIARYEARDGETTVARDSSTSDNNQVVCTGKNFIYSWVTQPQAANLSKGMYNDGNFTSDLANSYAWDTTLVFIQKCSGDNDYSQQNSINTNAADKGTNNEEVKDCVCNIFDMASNFREWTTETTSNVQYPCVIRGGYYANDKIGTDARSGANTSQSSGMSFRPILYL